MMKEDNKYLQTLLRNIPQVDNEAKKYATLSSADYLRKYKTKERLISETEKTFEGTVVKSFGTLLRDVPQVNKEAKKFMSVKPQLFKASVNITLPKEFKGQEVWKNFLTPITEQGECGNCWAHSSATVLADRFALLSLGQIKFTPSPYDLTICGAYQFDDIENQWKMIPALELLDDYFQGRKVDPRNELQSAACEGAALYTAANILYTEGVTTEQCFPSKASLEQGITYDVNATVAGTSQKLPYCYKLQGLDFDTCVDGRTAMRKYRAKTAYNVGDPERDSLDQLEQAIMYEIYRNGPVVSGFMIYSDFMDPSQFDGTGIYTHSNKNSYPQGGHAIKIVGWGEENLNGQLIPYWWIANSWGTSYGINGYFRMMRKIPECQLEMNVMTMLPDFQGMVITDPKVIPIESQEELDIRNFTHHYLDPTSGYYTSAIDKVKSCQLQGDITPYTIANFPFPDYETFLAGEINQYLQANPLPQMEKLLPIAYCGVSPSPTITLTPATTFSPFASLTPTPVSSTTSNSPATTFPPVTVNIETVAPAVIMATSESSSTSNIIALIIGLLVFTCIAYFIYRYISKQNVRF